MGFAMVGCGVLAGGPGAGAILQRNPNSLDWTGTWTYAGITTLGAGVVFIMLRIWKAGIKPAKV